MANPGQPTVSLGATGKAVRRLQRALRRTPNPSLSVDGTFGSQLEAAVKVFQEGAGVAADGIVGPLTWAALPDGRPMPLLREGSSGDVVRELQRVLTTVPQNGAHHLKELMGSSGLIRRLLSTHAMMDELESVTVRNATQGYRIARATAARTYARRASRSRRRTDRLSSLITEPDKDPPWSRCGGEAHARCR